MKTKNRKIGKCQKENEATEREETIARQGLIMRTVDTHSRRQQQQQASESCRTAHTLELPGLAWQGVEAGQHELLICITSSKEIYFLVLAKVKLCKWCVQNTIETFSRSTPFLVFVFWREVTSPHLAILLTSGFGVSTGCTLLCDVFVVAVFSSRISLCLG